MANVTDFSGMFAGASVFNQPVGNWNVSGAKQCGGNSGLNYMFIGAAAFNQSLANWQFGSNLTELVGLFQSASNFNGDVTTWNLTHVTTTRSLFYSAGAFNQNISTWQRSTPGDTSTMANVTNAAEMFVNAAAFNQNIGNWNVSSLQDAHSMFGGAQTFNQNLANWDVVSLTNGANMFDGSALSVSNYSALLIGWNALALHSNVSLGAASTGYSSTAAAALQQHGDG